MKQRLFLIMFIFFFNISNAADGSGRPPRVPRSYEKSSGRKIAPDWTRSREYPEMVKPKFKYYEVFSPLMCAVLEDNVRQVERCLEAGYENDSKERFSYSRTLLHVAHSEEIENMLLARDVRRDARDFNGKQPFKKNDEGCWVVEMGYEERCEIAEHMMRTSYMLLS